MQLCWVGCILLCRVVAAGACGSGRLLVGLHWNGASAGFDVMTAVERYRAVNPAVFVLAFSHVHFTGLAVCLRVFFGMFGSCVDVICAPFLSYCM
jgi:hypothetical protein